MAEYSAAEHFNNPSRQRVPTVVEFTLPLEPTAARQPGGNFIHKTTSETLRLTDQLHPNQTGPSSTGQTVDIKKTSSFQITSVRVSSSISNDGEDDSCGEVDDSQTEPSEVGSHNHIDVDGDLDTGGDDPPIMFVSNVPVSLAQQQVNEGGALKLEDKDHGLQRRFRVVKIESAEPFKRGRWLCMDFLDQPSVQPTLSKEEPGSGASSSGSLSDHISGEDVQHPHLTSNLHQPNQTLQSISSGAALNSCNQQAQPSSSIQIVPHSLPASAASVSYPQTQQQLLQQPIYQTQSPVPLVYPVASVSMLQQPTVAAAATSNPASLAIPLITTQPTSSVTAGATLPSLSSNVAQPFVQQPVPPGLLQQQQQQPPMASQPPYTAPPVAQQQQQQQQQQYVTPAATIQPGMTTQQHLPPQPQQTAQPVVAQIPVMAQQNLMTVPPSSSNNGAAQSSPHPPATALIQPSTSIPTQASSMHPVVLLPPPASLQQQPQPAPVVTVPIHGPPPGLIPQHPHPPIGLQQQQQQPGIQGQPTGAFVEVSTNPPVQSIQPSTQQLHQQQHVSQPSAAVVQPIGVPSIPTLQQQQQQQQQPEGVMQQQPVQQMQPIQQQHVQQQSGSILMQQPQQQQQTLVQQSVVYGSNNLTMPTPVMSVATSMQPQVQLIMAGPSTVTTAVVSSSSSTSAPPGGEAAMGTLPHGAGILSKSQSVVQDDGHAGSGVSTDDHASASGSSTVAIDNKIEQAMDLVKSHLMFAVREEVEVLKERIDVLMERIAYLESENQILRAAATQETLAQIAQLEATFPGSGTDNSGGSSVSVVGVASSIGAIVNNTITSTTTTTSTTTSCTSSQIPNGTSPAP